MRCGRSKSQGKAQFGPVEYSKREKFRGIKMHHVLPSRNVCIAYHGMTIPLPAQSLCGAYRNPVLPKTPFAGGGRVNEEECVKDSGYQSQFTSSSDSVSTHSGSMITPPCLVDSCSSGRKEDGNHQRTGQPVTGDHDTPRNPIPPSTPAIDPPVICPSSLSTSPSVVVNRPMPRKDWVHVGRGRALQQLTSQITTTVGRGQTKSTCRVSGPDTTSTGSVPSGDRPVGAEPCGCEADAPQCVGVEEAEEKETHSSCSSPDSRCGSSHVQPADATADTRTADGRPPNVESSTVVTTIEEGTFSSNCDAMAPSETADNFNTTDVAPPTSHHNQPQPSTCNTEQPVHTSPSRKTPSRSRKAKVCLAIQFKGTCPPQPIPKGSSTILTVNDTHKPLLMKPGDFTSPTADAVMAEPSAEKLERGDEKSETMAAQLSKDNVVASPQHEAGDTKSSGAVFTQVSGDSDFARSESEIECTPTRTAEGETLSSALRSRHCRRQKSSSESSDDEMEGGESGWAKLGRTTDEIEKSIAAYQRNAHRNQLELRRVQQKNRATEEMLVADMAEQCAEDEEEALQYYITQERESSIERVLELQFQFVTFSQATERRYGSVLEQDGSRSDHNKLTDMELKLEVESLEADDQLVLAKKESVVLQAKSELFDL